jgi:hypothetical protein
MAEGVLMKCPLPMKPATSFEATTVLRSFLAYSAAKSASSDKVVPPRMTSTSFWTAGGL